MKRILVASIIFLSISLSFGQYAITVDRLTLEWDANSETDLAGYKVYKRQTASPYGTVPLGVVPVLAMPTFEVTGLANGTWYFAVTAYNLTGAESARSNEISVNVSISGSSPPPPPSSVAPAAPVKLRIKSP